MFMPELVCMRVDVHAHEHVYGWVWVYISMCCVCLVRTRSDFAAVDGPVGLHAQGNDL